MKTLLFLISLAFVSLIPVAANATPIKVGQYYTWSGDGYSQYTDSYTLLNTVYYGNPPLIIEYWYRCQHNHSWGWRTTNEQWYDDETYESWEVALDPEWIDLYWNDNIYWEEYYYPGGGGGDEA